MRRFYVSLAIKSTYVVPIEAESEEEARAKAERILTPPAACINREWRRVVSVEEIEPAPRRISARDTERCAEQIGRSLGIPTLFDAAPREPR